MKETIIDFIKRNRVSTTEIADCMDKSGALDISKPVNSGHFRVGSLYWVYAAEGTNWHVHKQLENAKDGDVVFVEVFDNCDKAVFGDLVSKFLILYKQVSAVVTNGLLRDAAKLIKEDWPIWCNGFTPVGFSNQNIEISDESWDKIKSKKEFYHDAIAVCDDTGVVVIPGQLHTPEFLEKLVKIEEQEDTWFDCIDRKKYTTFEAVCLKKYLDE